MLASNWTQKCRYPTTALQNCWHVTWHIRDPFNQLLRSTALSDAVFATHKPCDIPVFTGLGSGRYHSEQIRRGRMNWEGPDNLDVRRPMLAQKLTRAFDIIRDKWKFICCCWRRVTKRTFRQMMLSRTPFLQQNTKKRKQQKAEQIKLS